MYYIETDYKDAALHFSIEEFIMQDFLVDEPVMMLWKTDKCVMLGSNQVAEAEIDLDCANNRDIQVVRRPSGGGTIYTDEGTILYSIIIPYSEKQCIAQLVKTYATDPIVTALNQMGIPAHPKGRNDILIEEKKISGLAKHIQHNRLCAHASLLYKTDLDLLTEVLNADDEKISTKAIRSVRNRVTNIKDHSDLISSTADFFSILKQTLLENKEIKNYFITEDDLKKIWHIYNTKYGDPTWTFRKSPRFSLHAGKRFENGKVDIFLNIVKGTVDSCVINGDFLSAVPVRDLEALLEHKVFNRQSFSEALNEFDLYPYLGGITKEQFLSAIFD
jgi:lipoate-protein ligase A